MTRCSWKLWHIWRGKRHRWRPRIRVMVPPRELWKFCVNRRAALLVKTPWGWRSRLMSGRSSGLHAASSTVMRPRQLSRRITLIGKVGDGTSDNDARSTTTTFVGSNNWRKSHGTPTKPASSILPVVPHGGEISRHSSSLTTRIGKRHGVPLASSSLRTGFSQSQNDCTRSSGEHAPGQIALPGPVHPAWGVRQ